MKLQHLQKLAAEVIRLEVAVMAVINQEVVLSVEVQEVEATVAISQEVVENEVADMAVICQEAAGNEVAVMVAEALEAADSLEAEAADLMLEKEQVKDFQVQS